MIATLQRPPTRVRYQVAGLLALAAALAYLCRNVVGVLESTLRIEFGLNPTQSGLFMSVFFWSYALFQIPGGWLGHIWGSRRALAFMAAIWAAGTALFGLATGLWMLLATQVMMGAAQAGLFACSANSISHWMPPAARSLPLGLLAVGMQVGATLAAAITASLVELSVPWRAILMLYSIPSFAWAAWCITRFRDQPQQHARVNAAELAIIDPPGEYRPDAIAERAPPTPWRAIARSRSMWFLCGQQVCRAAGYMFFASWFPTFLQETRGLSIGASGYMQGVVFGATLCGSLVSGWFTDRVLAWTGSKRISRQCMGATALGVCGLCILAAFGTSHLASAMALLAIGVFFAAAAGPPAMVVTIDIGGRHIPQVFAVMNMSGNLAAAATPVLVGVLFESTENWNLVLLLFACVYLAGAAFWAFVDPTREIMPQVASEREAAPASGQS